MKVKTRRILHMVAMVLWAITGVTNILRGNISTLSYGIMFAGCLLYAVGVAIWNSTLENVPKESETKSEEKEGAADDKQ